MNVEQEYEVVDISGEFQPLREHPDNPNLGDEQVIEDSIDVNGWYGAVVAQKSTGYILAGNHRFRVAKDMGAESIPVIWKDVSDEQALKIMLADNQTARRSDTDEEKLSELLQSLPDLSGTGFEQALHPLEREIEAGRGAVLESSNGTPAVGAAGHVPDAPSVPDDEYTPQYGVILVCSTEEDQEAVFELCKKTFGDQDIQVRLTAV